MKVAKELIGIGGALTLSMAVLLVAEQSWAEETKKNTTVPRPVGVLNSSNGSVFDVSQYGIVLWPLEVVAILGLGPPFSLTGGLAFLPTLRL